MSRTLTRLESRLKPGRVSPSGRPSPGFPELHRPPRTDPLDPWGRSAKSLEPHDSCVLPLSSLPCPPEAAVEAGEPPPRGEPESLRGGGPPPRPRGGQPPGPPPPAGR